MHVQGGALLYACKCSSAVQAASCIDKDESDILRESVYTFLSFSSHKRLHAPQTLVTPLHSYSNNGLSSYIATISTLAWLQWEKSNRPFKYTTTAAKPPQTLSGGSTQASRYTSATTRRFNNLNTHTEHNTLLHTQQTSTFKAPPRSNQQHVIWPHICLL